jgi:hypothetical protein
VPSSSRLNTVLPSVRVEEVDGFGHMAPLTDPDKVSPLIERFVGGALRTKEIVNINDLRRRGGPLRATTPEPVPVQIL